MKIAFTVSVTRVLALMSLVMGSACAKAVPVLTPGPLSYPGEVLPAPSPAPRAGPASLYPDPTRTPGALNANITQATIQDTICNPTWHGVNPWSHQDAKGTQSVRPPASYTTTLKMQQMAAWGLGGTVADYEEDHFIPLELGGNPVDAENLWPEAYMPLPGAREKDSVENSLRAQVCAGALTLKEAQDQIRTDWFAIYQKVRP